MKKRTKYELVLFAVLAVILFGRFAAEGPGEQIQETTAAATSVITGTEPKDTGTETTAETKEAAGTETADGSITASGAATSGKDTAPAAQTAPAAETTAAASETEESSEAAESPIAEDGSYTDKDSVALYIATYNHLPSNFITKKKAQEAGWDAQSGNLDEVCPGKSIGGGKYGNYERLLPEKDGRKYYECDINYEKGRRGAERIIYSNDGLIYYTGDHYKTFELLYGEP